MLELLHTRPAPAQLLRHGVYVHLAPRTLMVSHLARACCDLSMLMVPPPQYWLQGRFALQVASKALEYYAETVFKVPYPLKKSDLIAIPGAIL